GRWPHRLCFGTQRELAASWAGVWNRDPPDGGRRVRSSRAHGRERMRPCHGERGKAQQPRPRRLDARRPAPRLSRWRLQDGLQGLRRRRGRGASAPLVAERMVAAFALAPDGRSVAYAWDRQILVSDLDRNGRRSLVRPGG